MDNKDFIGNEVKIGDYVAFTRSQHSNMILGKIIGYTEKGFRVMRKESDGWTSISYKKDNYYYETILPYQCVKVS